MRRDPQIARRYKMARLKERLADAEGALATLEEAAGRDDLSVLERDGAILRLVYTFEAMWKTAALLLEEQEGIAVASPKATIRASRQTGLLSDEDAAEMLQIADDRNLTVQMYKGDLGDELADRLASHTRVLRHWLLGLRASPTYRLFARAMSDRKQIVCEYDGDRRELCPIILGHSKVEEKALTFQFDGESKTGLPPEGEWKCLFLEKVSGVRLREGPWRAGARHSQAQKCVEDVDLDVNPDSPYDPKRRIEVTRPALSDAAPIRNLPPRKPPGRHSSKR